MDLMDLYGILTMWGNHDERAVKNTKTDGFTLDTCLVTDRLWNYETAVKHTGFNNGDWIVLEGCETIEEAEAMHEKWLTILKGNPETLKDCYTEEEYKYEVSL